MQVYEIGYYSKSPIFGKFSSTYFVVVNLHLYCGIAVLTLVLFLIYPPIPVHQEKNTTEMHVADLFLLLLVLQFQNSVDSKTIGNEIFHLRTQN